MKLVPQQVSLEQADEAFSTAIAVRFADVNSTGHSEIWLVGYRPTGRGDVVLVIPLPKLSRGQLTEGLKQAPVVEPIDPFEGGKLDLAKVTPGITMTEPLGLL